MRKRLNERGFSLIELSMVLVLLGVMSFFLLPSFSEDPLSEGRRRLPMASESIKRFWVDNARLPCPANVDNTQNCNLSLGRVGWREMLLDEREMQRTKWEMDYWVNPMLSRRHPTDPSTRRDLPRPIRDRIREATALPNAPRLAQMGADGSWACAPGGQSTLAFAIRVRPRGEPLPAAANSACVPGAMDNSTLVTVSLGELDVMRSELGRERGEVFQ